MTLCVGMPLIARINKKSFNVVNNETFVIEAIKQDIIVIRNTLKEKVEIPINKINRFFYLGFCVTIHKSQGQTFNEPYTIHEFNRLDSRLKYVAFSRASLIDNICIKLI
jgi:ATP-dependent exoDNAse (exonuclease V) alpha subunit